MHEKNLRFSSLFFLFIFCTILGILLINIGCHRKTPSNKNSHSQQAQGTLEHPYLLPRDHYVVAKLANGVLTFSSVLPHQSHNFASALATSPQAYQLDLKLHVEIPHPATTLDELRATTPELSEALPNLASLLPPTPVSRNQDQPKTEVVNKIPPEASLFELLYQKKEASLEYEMTQLGELLAKETLYDCQTLLQLRTNLEQPPALLIQAIMNVNADGSDGDRNLPLEKLSSCYQPQTNYRWPKATNNPNPNLNEYQQEIDKITKQLQDPQLSSAQREKLQTTLHTDQETILELKRWSFLNGTADPFIVLPKFLFSSLSFSISSDSNSKKTAVGVGDYALILYQKKLYPAIVGDIGPSSKIGEASLRLCKAIDPLTSAGHRPVSKPEVNYIIFPGSADHPFSSPNYEHWQERCHTLWHQLGGSDILPWQDWNSGEQPANK